jgi:hypothetical protein
MRATFIFRNKFITKVYSTIYLMTLRPEKNAIMGFVQVKVAQIWPNL